MYSFFKNMEVRVDLQYHISFRCPKSWFSICIYYTPFKFVAVCFPHSSVGQESACNAGDPGSIPGTGRSAGEGIGYPLQYSWASILAQLVKNPPVMQGTLVHSLGWKDPLEKGKATYSSILSWGILSTIQSLGVTKIEHNWVTFAFTLSLLQDNGCVFLCFAIYPYYFSVLCVVVSIS